VVLGTGPAETREPHWLVRSQDAGNEYWPHIVLSATASRWSGKICTRNPDSGLCLAARYDEPMDSSPRAALELAYRHVLDYLDSLDTRPVAATASLADLRTRLRKPLNDSPIDAAAVVRDLVCDTHEGIVASAGGRFFAWAVSGTLPSALAADWLTSAWDQNAGIYVAGPAASVVEEAVGDWLKQLLELPAGASFGLVSGCQMAHATCLAAARHYLLQARGWDVERRGMAGSPPIRILASNRHGSVERSARLVGIGADQIVDLPLTEAAQTTADALQQELDRDPSAPTVVLLQAGDLNSGSFDDYSALIPIARRYDAWVHIDGAFGLWAAASPCYRHFVAGVGAADSWATDGHKWLNVPYDSGYAFVAHPEAHRAAISYQAPYLAYDEEARDQIHWNPEWSRRARGFASYAALRELGCSGVADLVARCCRYAADIVDGLAQIPGVEVVWRPRINQGMVRFLDPSPNATEADHDRFTDRIVQGILANGEAFFMATTWRGRRAMRVSVFSWRTTPDDVRRSIDAVGKALNSSY
jgi:glutamate/tyrosine decarboxylase-like PLP-dependent enzyme